MVDIELIPYPGEDEDSFIKRKAYYLRIVKRRLNYGNHSIEKKMVSAISLNEIEKEEINAFWEQYMSSTVRNQLIDYRYYSVFKNALIEGERLSNYIPDTFYYAFIDEYYTNPQHSSPCDDKNMYDLYFHDINRPKTVFRKIDDMFLDENYSVIKVEDAIKKAKDEGEVILKIGKFSEGGQGEMLWDSIRDNENRLIEFLKASDNIVCQEIIKQHKVLNDLNPSSVNTVRIMTLIFNNEVHLMSSAIRFGASGNRTDNINSGGLACGLYQDGRLKSIAYDIAARKYNCHQSGQSFDEITIPSYGQCVDIVTTLAKRFVSISKLISWDLAIDEKGNPLLIEFNLAFGGINFHQICNGPILGNLTHDVLTDVFANSYTLKSIIKSYLK